MNNTEKILNFWFNNSEKWFSFDSEFDKLIKDNFLKIYEDCKIIKLDKDKLNIKELLSLIILFDQLSRNMFRNTSKMYETDKLALDFSLYVINNQLEKDLTQEEKSFVYMPLMHSEDLEIQKKCVKLFDILGNEFSKKYAIEHMEIIEKYGRFPHRNEILNRKSSDEELEFLKTFKGF